MNAINEILESIMRATAIQISDLPSTVVYDQDNDEPRAAPIDFYYSRPGLHKFEFMDEDEEQVTVGSASPSRKSVSKIEVQKFRDKDKSTKNINFVDLPKEIIDPV